MSLFQRQARDFFNVKERRDNMSVYQALYRKWRPMRFEDVSGQSQVSETLKTAISNGRISHAYLFCGTRGTGKTSTAKIFSRAVNCESPVNGEPCNECASCRGILDGSILDVYEMDAASNRGVENIREIRDEVIYTPVGCKYKVYIIDEVHMLTTEAFNALLKTLEEPPAHTIFILATTEPHKIPATVLSRCQRFDFKRISVRDIAERITKIADNEGIDITPDGIEAVAELGDGSMRDAISILDRCITFGQDKLTASVISDIMGVVGSGKLFEIVDAIGEDNSRNALMAADEVLKEGKEAQNLIENLISHFRALLVCKTTDDPGELLEKTESAVEKYKTQANGFSVERIVYSINMLGDYLAQSKWLSDPKLAAEQGVIRLASYNDDESVLLKRIEKLEAALLNMANGGVVSMSVEAVKPVKKEEKELPPWDIEEPVKTPEAVETSEPVEPTSKPAGEVAGGDLWTKALEEIKKESKLLYAFLYTGSCVRCGDTMEIEVAGEVAYGKIATPNGIEYLSKMFSDLSGEDLSVKVFIKGERVKKEEVKEGFSIKDLADKKSVFGDKIDIL